ncbi:protein phosphatase 1, regulatory subunit, partial [Coemansia sp. RSA 2603]
AVGAQKSSVPVLTPIRKPTPSFSVFELSPVVLESVSYAAGTLSGTIKVHNLAFEKSVTVRITMDNWRSFEDVPATFIRSIIGVDGSRPGVDRFRFNMAVLQLTSNESVDISMCVCYRTNGQEFWDNNSGINYIFKLAYAHTADGLDTTLAKPKQSLDTMSSPKRTPAFSYSFGSVATTATNASALSQPSSLPTSASAVSGADARRYMRYSEAKFAAVSPFNHSMQSSTQAFLQESCATRGSAYAMDYLYRMHSPMRTPSPIMRTGSPLLNMPWTSSAQLLHC